MVPLAISMAYSRNFDCIHTAVEITFSLFQLIMSVDFANNIACIILVILTLQFCQNNSCNFARDILAITHSQLHSYFNFFKYF